MKDLITPKQWERLTRIQRQALCDLANADKYYCCCDWRSVPHHIKRKFFRYLESIKPAPYQLARDDEQDTLFDITPFIKEKVSQNEFI